MTDKIVRAVLTEPTYINGVLLQAGEMVDANLDELGVKSLDEKHEDGSSKTPSLELANKNEAEPIAQVEIAAVAPHAPNPTIPQGIPAGSINSGSGRIVSVDDDGTAQMVAPGASTISDSAKLAKPEKK